MSLALRLRLGMFKSTNISGASISLFNIFAINVACATWRLLLCKFQIISVFINKNSQTQALKRSELQSFTLLIICCIICMRKFNPICNPNGIFSPTFDTLPLLISRTFALKFRCYREIFSIQNCCGCRV